MDAMGGMMAGSSDSGISMFSRLTPTFKPDADEMAKQRDAALYNKTVKFTGYNARIFDLGNEQQRTEYEALMQKLYVGALAKTHSVLCTDRQFVVSVPTWIAFIEWIEFDLEITANETVPPAEGGEPEPEPEPVT
jgi:hypothetical protein